MREIESGWYATSRYQSESNLGILSARRWVWRARVGQLLEKVRNIKLGLKHLAWSELASSFHKFLFHIFLLEVNYFSLRSYSSLCCQKNYLSQGQCLQAMYFLSSISYIAFLHLLHCLQKVLLHPPLTHSIYIIYYPIKNYKRYAQ